MVKSTVPLSVLDTAPVWRGSTPAQSLRDMMDLAKNVERLGYHRYWVAEHHNTLSIASSSPAVLVGQLASVTTSLRVGSGGVMLPNHPPLVIAEQFGTLEALHSGRIDLGIGRAPGTDPTTAKALRRTTDEMAGEDFPKQIAELMAYFSGPVENGSGKAIHAIPAEGNGPPLWLLGSSGASAEVAGRLGLPFAFAHHINPGNTLGALEIYRESFQPSAALAEPYVLVCAMVIAADTEERAEWFASSIGLTILRMRGGLPQGPHTPPEEASAYPYTPEETDLIKQMLSSRIIGGPDTVRRKVHELLASTKADELMVVTLIHGQENRVRSYELVAEAVALGQPDQVSAL
ncbi:LLM class flavin-dependent oxidoreductase [Actinocrispum wychmicini]|uniref:Luciferase family oxidoreductase group 1 n=1 Tax=Actinocrispum wychmicini TaxID=1213861 RepID=A0A4R2JY12_9PSEU|nr:LLM class flavin-dependent oxidoreductase [Actinocrispum wychmicini]TCO62318.1 luciferase family oxidoreductase group 1 [Actinocrispum wychmicini]